MDKILEKSRPQRLELGAERADRRSSAAFRDAFRIEDVPADHGCYIMRDAKGRVVYVGKAKNLRARLRSYLNETDSRYSVQFLMRRVADIEFLVTTNEKEALLLENSLIKQYKPRYNVRWKDDKTYVSLRIDTRQDFPRVTVVRRYKKDGAKYFGPYPSAQALRKTLRQVQRLFPLRKCSDSVMRNRMRPCLYYQMKQCAAPCVGLIDRASYHAVVDDVVLALQGRDAELERRLLDQIRKHSDALEFEKAAELRDRLYALRQTLERQRAVAVPGAEDRDVFGVYTQGRFTEIQAVFYRGGKMVGGRSFSFKEREMPVDELLGSFLLQYYQEAPTLPAEVLVPIPLEEADTLAGLLTEQRGTKVVVRHPLRADKRSLVDLANRNAKSSFEEKRLAEDAQRDLLEQTRAKLGLSREPFRIECFDISTIQGDQSVGAMAVFEGGTANKNRYRRFAVKGVAGQDDFAMLREVLMRRYRRAVEEDDLPDLVLIDGGRGQLNVAAAVLKDLAIEDLDAAAIAKARAQDGGGRSPERFFVPGRSNPIVLPQNSDVVKLLARVRDEAHRFAVTYHRKRRKKSRLRTQLTDIPGIGPKRALALLKAFGSIARIRDAAVEEIAAAPGFSRPLAERVASHLEVNRKHAAK